MLESSLRIVCTPGSLLIRFSLKSCLKLVIFSTRHEYNPCYIIWNSNIDQCYTSYFKVIHFTFLPFLRFALPKLMASTISLLELFHLTCPQFSAPLVAKYQVLLNDLMLGIVFLHESLSDNLKIVSLNYLVFILELLWTDMLND